MSKLLKYGLIVFVAMALVGVIGGYFSANEAVEASDDPERPNDIVNTDRDPDPYPVGDSTMYINQDAEREAE